MKPRLQVKYLEEVRPALQEKRGYKNVHQIPKMEKIVINMGVGEAAADKKKLEEKKAEYDAAAKKLDLVSLCRMLLNANEFVYVD